MEFRNQGSSIEFHGDQGVHCSSKSSRKSRKDHRIKSKEGFLKFHLCHEIYIVPGIFVWFLRSLSDPGTSGLPGTLSVPENYSDSGVPLFDFSSACNSKKGNKLNTQIRKEKFDK